MRFQMRSSVKRCKRLANASTKRGAGIFGELETGAGSLLNVERFDRIIESAGGPHNRHRTILQTVNLIQAAGLIARRHQKHIGAGFDFVGDGFVVGDFYADAAGICGGKRARRDSS